MNNEVECHDCGDLIFGGGTPPVGLYQCPRCHLEARRRAGLERPMDPSEKGEDQ